ncbi:hypothetical protein [Mycobacteroides abscessus]|uniref:hypothetical protein n=1 Tax=Mycobacteroides abscessus TaxID=36809 RepID=UPI0009D0C595|nr:hypothetical protein [Mycobacteroides abscessus]SLB99682.1 Uncharacterised protein [Mycobacteroides abscessus subsp. abscessus]SLG10053.1 Uncharacterised protein [Mycobacteroides abscessus subsp. abscessus]
MKNNNQSRPGTKILAALAIALGVSIGVVGCGSTHPTTSGSSSAGETSSSASAQNMVDVSAVWVTHPMPDCPRVVIGNATASPGLVLPDDASVARQLAGVRSPGSESWVREKLGWVTKWLGKTRADIISDPSSPGVPAQSKRFSQYVEHIRTELEAGKDISDSALDGRFPEGCA